nr:MAG TPA: hypothetical protein [Caudoviricetes sp.]
MKRNIIKSPQSQAIRLKLRTFLKNDEDGT